MMINNISYNFEIDLELEYYPFIKKKNNKLIFEKKEYKWINYDIFIFAKDCNDEEKKKIIEEMKLNKYFRGCNKKLELYFIIPSNYI